MAGRLGLRNLRHPLGSLRQRRRLAAGCKHGFGHTAGITPGVCGAGAGAIRGPMKSRVAIIGLGSIGKLVLQELLDEASQDFQLALVQRTSKPPAPELPASVTRRSEEHTSELQSLMRISYAVFC